MIPPELIARQRRTLQALQTLAMRDLLAVWRRLDLGDARAATDALLPLARDLTGAYGDMAAVAAADFYEDARDAAGPPGRFMARAAPPVPAEQAEALVRWAVTPLWAVDPRIDAALSRLAGGTQRLIRAAERDTIFTATMRDPAGPRYARVPQANACPFCLMLASRGGVYHDGEDAGRPFHDHCRCLSMPVWTPDDVPDVNRRLADEWAEVASAAPDPRAAWREHIVATRGGG